jgi:hypothetical protein
MYPGDVRIVVTPPWRCQDSFITVRLLRTLGKPAG